MIEETPTVPERVRIIYDDAPVHCIDILNGLSDRLLRIRPDRLHGRVTIDCSLTVGKLVLSMSAEEAHELARAIEALATQVARS